MSIWWGGVLAVAAVLLAYHFVLYPATVIVWARGRTEHRVDPLREDQLPSVSLVIAAYNEQRVIAGKLRNALALEYPRELLEILVVSDGSSDRTHEIVQSFAWAGVRALHRPERAGKSAALNRGVEAARGQIVVLSDANNDFDPRAVRALVRHFQNPDVGGVCGRKAIRAAPARESSRGDGLYWRYESAIKIAESALGVVTTADGEILAIRRGLWRPIPPEVINDDAEISFALVQQGYRLMYEPEAVSTELASQTLEDDYRVKVRMIAGGFQTVRRHWRQLWPPRTRFAWMFLSHKLLRWLVPVILMAGLVASIALWRTPWGALALSLQAGFYGLALLGWVSRNRGRLPTWKYVPLYFGLMNVAALAGMRRFLRGETIQTLWQKAAR